MAERCERKWCASNHMNSITFKKLTAWEIRCPRGTYHDTWEEAHAALVARREEAFRKAQSAFDSAHRALMKAKNMKPPAAPMTGSRATDTGD